MKGRAVTYSNEELEFIESVSQWPRSQAHAAFCEKFRRDDVTLHNFSSLCKRKRWLTGRTGQFAQGAEPHNKGRKCGPGQGGNHPNARRTQFRKGNRTGKANQNYQPVGTERISEDGYRERKVHDGLPLHSRWQLVHRLEWEAANGSVPEGYCLKCLGDRLNTDPSNWELIPRALLPRLAGGNRYNPVLAFDDAPDELKPTVLAVAKVQHAARNARKRA